MLTSHSSINPHAIITSIRELARNTELRQRAMKEKKPIIVEDRRKKSFFVLWPPAMHDLLYEIYENLHDAEMVETEIKKNKKLYDWEEVENNLNTKFNI